MTESSMTAAVGGRPRANLDVHPGDVEDDGLQVIGQGLQGGGALLAAEQVARGAVGGLQLLLLGRRLLVQAAQELRLQLQRDTHGGATLSP